jgi:hypothetical protein
MGTNVEFLVENGAIVARARPGATKSFLCTDASYADFELELEFQIEMGINSGIQIRSASLPNYKNGVVHGYQVEIDPGNRPHLFSGSIYDEERRKEFLDSLAGNTAAQRAFRPGSWNTLRVRAIGDSIQTWLNGVAAADVTDSLSADGFLAIQALPFGGEGQTREARFRNIRLQPLSATTPQAPSTGPQTRRRAPSRSIPNTLTFTERREGWRLLFDGKTLRGWQGSPRYYSVENGSLVSNFGPTLHNNKDDGQLFTEREYADFNLGLDFKLEPGANSGLLLRCPPSGLASREGMEIQILDDSSPRYAESLVSRPWMATGAISGVVAPELGHLNPPGEWNEMEIRCQGRRLQVALNDSSILDADLDAAARNPADGEDRPGLRRSQGHIGLFGWCSAGRVEYRNIRIQEIGP